MKTFLVAVAAMVVTACGGASPGGSGGGSGASGGGTSTASGGGAHASGGGSASSGGGSGGGAGGGAASGGGAAGSGKEGWILFQRQVGTAHVLSLSFPDGGEQALTSGVDALHGQWTRDGQGIVYVRRGSGGAADQLWAMSADGTGARLLVDVPKGYTVGRLSPDGTRVLLTGGMGATAPDLAALGLDGGLTTILGSTASEGSAGWSPDGTQIAYHRVAAGMFELWVADADGSNPHRIAGPLTDFFVAEPVWSTQGLIAFSVGDFESDLYTVQPDGGALLKRSTAAGGENHPSWSADGKSLACYHYEPGVGAGGKYGVFVLDVASGQLTMRADGGEQPEFHP